MSPVDENESTIPIVHEPPPHRHAVQRPVVGMLLVVDPDARARRVVRDALESIGHCVFEARDASHAHVVLGHLNAAPDLVVASQLVGGQLVHDPRVPKVLVLPFDRPFALHQLERLVASALRPPLITPTTAFEPLEPLRPDAR